MCQLNQTMLQLIQNTDLNGQHWVFDLWEAGWATGLWRDDPGDRILKAGIKYVHSAMPERFQEEFLDVLGLKGYFVQQGFIAA